MFLTTLPIALGFAASTYALPFVSGTTASIPSAYLQAFENPSIQTSIGNHAICVSGMVNVTASATNLKINYGPIANQSVLTTFVTDLTTNATAGKGFVSGQQEISGTYGISAELCFPVASNDKLNMTVQFLVHGGGYDRTYWNLAQGYSYVDYVAQQGYITFSYDRLGSGLSDHPSGTNVVQNPLQIEVAHQLIQHLRTGGLKGIPAFEKVIAVGHSMGSIASAGVTAKYPADFDAVILTGISKTTPGAALAFAGVDLQIAALADPSRLGDLAYDYATAGSEAGIEYFFFKAPNFDPKLLDMSETFKQTLTIGELLTGTPAVSSNYTGPVFVVNGENDLPNCVGDCLSPTNIQTQFLAYNYPAASNSSSSYTLPVCGHGLNAHYTANLAYDQMLAWLQKVGL